MSNFSFNKIQNLIIDMDGVLWRGNTPLPGLKDFVNAIHNTNRKMLLATNNSSKTINQYLSKLQDMGIKATANEILTSSQATGNYLNNLSQNDRKVFVIGQDGLIDAMKHYNFQITNQYADYVVVGVDTNISWDKLNTAVQLIRSGSKFIGTNPDTTYPTENGIGVGNGIILAAIEAATNVKPMIIGKPERHIFDQALDILGADPSNTLMIGDRLDTDILGAKKAGISSLLVLTGVTDSNILTDSDIQPDVIMNGLPEITVKLYSSETQ